MEECGQGEVQRECSRGVSASMNALINLMNE